MGEGSGPREFSKQLLSEPTKSCRRVIVEELLHLGVPNHGRPFKALLKNYLEMD